MGRSWRSLSSVNATVEREFVGPKRSVLPDIPPPHPPTAIYLLNLIKGRAVLSDDSHLSVKRATPQPNPHGASNSLAILCSNVSRSEGRSGRASLRPSW